MPTLQENPPTTEQPFVETHGRASLPILLEALQTLIDKREPLKDYEKEAYCDLLWKVKQIQLCACNGSTHYGTTLGSDIELGLDDAAHQPKFYQRYGELNGLSS